MPTATTPPVHPDDMSSHASSINSSHLSSLRPSIAPHTRLLRPHIPPRASSSYSNYSARSTPSTSTTTSSRSPFRHVFSRLSSRREEASDTVLLLSSASEPAMLSSPMLHSAYPPSIEVIHPYNFFEAALHMAPNLTILEDGFQRLRTAK
jgi:hypothetical protein